MLERRALALPALIAGIVAVLLLGVELLSRTLEREDARTLALRFERPPEASDGTLRLFTFGASSIFGNPVPELGIVAQLRFWLERGSDPPEIEVFNYAIPGSPSWAIREAVERAIEWEPDVIFVHTGFGEFLLKDPTPSRRVMREALRHSAFVRILRDVLGRIRAQPVAALETPIDVRPFDRDGPEFRERVARYQPNVEAIIALARSHGVPLLLATAISNLADWPPTNRTFAETLYADGPAPPLGTIQALLDAGGFREAQELAEDALASRPNDAYLFFLLGRAQAGLGAYAQARRAFVRARDLDPVPWRVLSPINEFLRSAAGREGVVLVDLEEALAARAEHGLTGFDLIADNAHPTPAGASVIAGEILRALGALGQAPAAAAAHAAAGDPLESFLAHAREAARPRDLEGLFLLKSAQYCMGFPFLNYEGARMYLRELALRDRSGWVAWANLAAVSYLEKNVERGNVELRRAVALRGGARGIDGSPGAPRLREAMQAAGIDLETALLQGRFR